jgi:hypothetical protein
MEIRLLTNKDLNLFDNFLVNIYNSADISVSEKSAWSWYRGLLEQNKKDAVFSALINNGSLDTVFCSFAVDVMYSYRVRHIPFWVAGLVRSVKFSSNTPDIKIDSLTTPVSMVYEQFGYKSFYIVRVVPASVNYNNIELYINRVQNKNFLPLRYKPYLDRFIDSPETYQEFDIIKHIIPKSIPLNKKIALFRYDLKYEFCK